MNKQYQKLGYSLVPQFLNRSEIAQLSEVVNCFHQSWLEDHQAFYQSHAVNSAYLTGTKYLNDEQRLVLFKLIGSAKVAQQLALLPVSQPAFINTQLFFDPANAEQKNYWHRDCQYHLDLEQQEQALQGPEALHFRIALVDEPGIEVIPQSHKVWDSEEQLKVRYELEDHKRHFDLAGAVSLPLKQGDLLIFSANMIHRGLYGNDRKALDLVFGENNLAMLEFVEKDCLPSSEILELLDNTSVFTTV